MQCWNCGFENLPGLAACGRCASALDLAAVAVEPPRASAWRLRTRLSRAAQRGKVVGTVLRAAGAQIWSLRREDVAPATLAWSLVPGYGLIHDGRALLGALILGIWLTLGACFLLALATSWQSPVLMMMVLVHSVSISIVLASNLAWERYLVRAAFGVAIFFLTYMLLYAPLGWLSGQFVSAIEVNNVAGCPAVQDGDSLLLAGPWLPQRPYGRGDVVLYRVPENWGVGVQVHEGILVDRIVAGPGDHLEVAAGEVIVNGAPADARQRPLGAVSNGFEFDRVLQQNEFFILPTTMLVGGRYLSSDVVRELCSVRPEQIEARVLYRVRPLRRWGPVE